MINYKKESERGTIRINQEGIVNVTMTKDDYISELKDHKYFLKRENDRRTEDIDVEIAALKDSIKALTQKKATMLVHYKASINCNKQRLYDKTNKSFEEYIEHTSQQLKKHYKNHKEDLFLPQ